MSGVGLVDPYLKLGRAKKHLDTLDDLLKEFTGDKAYTVTFYDDLKEQRHVMECKLHDVPDDICLTVGDVFYNMRSCLDQIVWSLAFRIGKIIDPDYTQFPVMEVDNSASRKRLRQQTEGVPEPARDQIMALQPYHRGNAYKSHPIWRLDAMCNLDKHRRIPANGSEAIFKFPKIAQGDILGIQPHGKGVVIEAPLDLRIEALDNCHKLSVPLRYKGKLQLDPSVPFKVNFGGTAASFTEDRNGIGEIYQFVSDAVLPKFMRFFP